LTKRIVVTSLIGSVIERYDVFLYALVAGIIMNKYYFPTSDPFISTILAYSSVLIGYIARPLGALVFGHFGDKIGRKNMLIVTILVTGIATVCMGLLPNYYSIGIIAPIMLCVFRFLQGFGLGGEWGGATLMTYESVDKSKRGLYCGLVQGGLPMGMCLSSGIVSFLMFILSPEQYTSWGWRISFLFSAVLVAIGIWARFGMPESKEFKELKENRKVVKVPIKELFKQNTREVILGIMARHVEGVIYSVYGIWIVNYLTNLKVAKIDAVFCVTVSAIVMSFCLPMFGYISDKIGLKKVYIYGCLASAVLIYPTLFLIQNFTSNPSVIWTLVAIPFGILYSAIFGTQSTIFCGLFPTQTRYTGISFVYQFSAILSSGLTPIICVVLYQYFNSVLPISLYVIFSALMSAYAVYKMKLNTKEEY
jgi:MHS family metabolite:H+ symporter-like MFS transporter